MEIGTRIKEIIRRLGVKQADLAAKAGIGEGHLSKIVNNHLTPDPETVKKIAEALNISMSVLYDDTEINDKVLIESVIRELPDDLIEFIRSRPNTPYLYLAKDLSDSDLSPEMIRRVVELWKKTVEDNMK